MPERSKARDGEAATGPSATWPQVDRRTADDSRYAGPERRHYRQAGYGQRDLPVPRAGGGLEVEDEADDF